MEKGEFRTCSLMQAFDRLQLCFTVFPQMTEYYRFGRLKECRIEREDFNFCWSTKSMEKTQVHVAKY
jgi:hypothetical protein